MIASPELSRKTLLLGISVFFPMSPKLSRSGYKTCGERINTTKGENNNMSSKTNAAKIKEEVEAIEHGQRTHHNVMEQVENIIGAGSNGIYKTLNDEQRKDFLAEAARYVGSKARHRMLVEDVERATQANVTSPRWLANAALTGIIGGAAFATTKIVLGATGHLISSAARAVSSGGGGDHVDHHHQPFDRVKMPTATGGAPTPYDSTAPCYTAADRPGGSKNPGGLRLHQPPADVSKL
jgi:hypothetical protein